MVVGKFPYKGKDDFSLFKNILKGELKIPSFLSAKCKSLLQAILVNHPEQRITSKKIIDDEWFGNLRW